MNWLNTLIDDYYKWLRDKTIIKEATGNEWSVIDTPFIGLFNDTIELYVKRDGEKIKLTDDGETIHNLDLVGVSLIHSKPRREIVNRILLNYGIQLIENELRIETTPETFSQKKHNILSAIIEMNDLYVMSKHTIATVFKEDVRQYLDNLDIIYTPDFISRGSTGLEFAFDFQIAQKNKEIVIKSFNSLNQTYLASFLFKWEDIKPVREEITKKEVRAIAVINDENRKVNPEYIEALASKNANTILWSQRNQSQNTIMLIGSA